MTDLQNSPPDSAVVLVNLQKLLKAKDKLASANGELRAVLKHMDGKDIHLGAAKRTVKLMKSEDEDKLQDTVLEMSMTLQYLQIAGFTITKSQRDLFDLMDHDPAAEPIIDKAKREGRTAGLLGKDEADCLHQPGTEARNAWIEAFRQGEGERKTVLSMEMKPHATSEVIPGAPDEADSQAADKAVDDALADGGD